ncbi:tetratricopeptide repeat protein [Streptomyces sp. NPDC059002]|uniref:AfsR/SARP family transcriptional regulator n=1 Tax=Streptomyces sp. NPDC059002 TaxID=3346690 RepID=UPI0036A54C04
MEFEIRLSGPVEVRAAGRRGDIGSTKTRLAFAALAWDASRTVGMDTLIRRIWDEDPPVKAREALHAHVSRIRKALRIVGGAAPAVVSRTNAYVMDVDPDRVDLRSYTSCVDQARSLKDSKDDDAALRLLDHADTLWRGEPLAGITGSWAEHLRATVAESSLAAAMLRADILMRAGKFTEAVPVLLPLADDHPVDEALAEHLAIALYGSSRTAEATRLLQRTRQRVVRDIGLDAGRRLRRVHQGILSATPAKALLDHHGTGRQQPAGRPRGVPDNVPRDIPWVGRHDELRRLTAALCEGNGTSAAVVTVEAIDGMGGVGKTALAVHLAHRLRDRFPDGRLFLHLGGHASDRDPLTAARALTELLRLLGVPPMELPQNLDELVSLWRATVRDRRMIVILDDAADTGQVGPLLPGESPTAVVVTSRRRLPGLPGVRPVSLDVLPRDDAVALFLRRVDGRCVTREPEVEEIVRLCGHLPLAIEIAASRLLSRPSWTTSDLLDQLTAGGEHLSELHDGERTVRHVFELSSRALTATQRLVFRRTGLHFGVDFAPHAVAALAGLPVGTTERILEELLSQHLISEPSPHRFTMHDLLREYARSLFDDESGIPGEVAPEGESRLAVRRLVDHYIHVADRADRLAYPFRSRIPLDTDGLSVQTGPEFNDAHTAERWFMTESANLLDVLDWIRQNASERQLALAVHALAGFLDMEGHLGTAAPLLRRAADHWRAVGDHAAGARAQLDLSAVHTHSGQYEEGIAAAREALDIARDLEDAELESEAIHQLSIPLWQTGRYALVRSLQQHSLTYLLQTGKTLQVARTHNLLGIAHLHLGQHKEAIECFLSALSGFTKEGDDRGRYRTLNNMAELYRKNGDPKAAERSYREAIELSNGMGSRGDHATLQMNLANVLTTLHKPEEALALYGKALPVLRGVGDRLGEGIALNGIGRAHRIAGRGEQALPQHVAALAVVRHIRAEGEIADVLYGLARVELDTGRRAQAVAHLEESLSICRRIGARAEEARASRELGRLRGRGY